MALGGGETFVPCSAFLLFLGGTSSYLNSLNLFSISLLIFCGASVAVALLVLCTLGSGVFLVDHEDEGFWLTSAFSFASFASFSFDCFNIEDLASKSGGLWWR